MFILPADIMAKRLNTQPLSHTLLIRFWRPRYCKIVITIITCVEEIPLPNSRTLVMAV